MKLKKCPYCLQDIESEAALIYECSHKEHVQSAMTVKQQGRVTCSGNQKNSGVCTGCRGERLTKRVCPHCEQPLNASLLNSKNLLFSIIGSSSAGKSCYFAVMLHELARMLPGINRISFSQMKDGATSMEDKYNQMTGGTLLDPTKKDEAKKPFIYRLSGNISRLGFLTDERTLTFFDGAGEVFDGSTMEEIHQQYIADSKGILLLLDPLSLPEVRNHLRNKEGFDNERLRRNGANDVMQNDVVSSLNEILQQIGRRAIFSRKSVKIPVAVVFSKFDMILPCFDPSSAVCQSSPHSGMRAFVTRDAQNVSSEINDWLQSWGAANFLNLLDTSFTTVQFFGISSLGNEPRGMNRAPAQIMPHRVVDPMLWLLSKEGIIPSA